MIVSVNLNESDINRLNELKFACDAVTQSEVLRNALREYHKKIFA